MTPGRYRTEKSIALVGMMGAGKSSVGRRLAKRLDLPFIDADAEIEAAAGLSIAEMFETYGEPYFRDGERRVLARLIDGPVQVIATGGGAFIDERSRVLLLERCTVVWLDAAIETLATRVARSDRRPLLQGQDPHEALTRLAAERRPVYAQAQHRIAVDAPADDLVERILAALG